MYYIYILTNKKKGTLYIGITNNIQRRMNEHKHILQKGFTQKYNLNLLVYMEEYFDVREAIQREKQLKNWKRDWKKQLIFSVNPEWKDLSEDMLF